MIANKDRWKISWCLFLVSVFAVLAYRSFSVVPLASLWHDALPYLALLWDASSQVAALS